MAGKTVGELQIELKMDGKSLNASMKNVQKDAQSAGKTGGNLLGNAFAEAAGKIIAQGISTVTSGIMSQLDGAIKRVDTINAYPKLMKNFGVANDEAKASIERISESVQGLPTSLDDAVGGVQDLFLVTKDLKQAEDIFTSINDAAMIFANGSSDATSRFIYAYKQAMSAGKVSAQDFNQMNEAIPGVMDKVAEVMGITFAEMKQGLSDGSISVDEFNKALNTLDKEGVGDMNALRDGVFDATGGIQTTIERLQSAIQRGWASIIETIGQDNIENIINTLGKAIETVMKAIGGVINFVIQNKWIWPFLAAALAALVAIMAIVVSQMIAATVAQIGLNTAMLANPIVWIIALIVGIIAAIVLLITHFDQVKEVARVVCEAIGNFFKGLWDGIVAIFSGVVGFFTSIFQGAWNAIKSIFGKVVDWFKGIFNGIVNVFKTVGTTIGNAVGGAFKAVVNGIIGFAERFVNAPIKAINALIDVINAVPGISLGKLTELKLPRMAQGGLVTASTVANIGENGREAVLPLDRNTDNWSGLLASALADEFDARGGGGGGGITIEKQIFDISNEMDADDIGRKVMNSLRRAA